MQLEYGDVIIMFDDREKFVSCTKFGCRSISSSIEHCRAFVLRPNRNRRWRDYSAELSVKFLEDSDGSLMSLRRAEKDAGVDPVPDMNENISVDDFLKSPFYEHLGEMRKNNDENQTIL